jgi:hypothetical protein
MNFTFTSFYNSLHKPWHSCEKFEKSKSEMLYCHIERGIKEAAVRLHERDLLPLEDILDVLRISRRTFYRVWKLYRETGSVVAAKNPSRAVLQVVFSPSMTVTICYVW